MTQIHVWPTKNTSNSKSEKEASASVSGET